MEVATSSVSKARRNVCRRQRAPRVLLCSGRNKEHVFLPQADTNPQKGMPFLPDATNAETALAARLKDRPLLVWAVLKEDTYESKFGDGYYAYVAHAFLSEEAARHAAANANEEWMKWHVRAYNLFADGYGGCTIWPVPTEAEPTTVSSIAAALRASGLI